MIFSAFVLNVKRGKKLHLNLLCPMFLCYGLLMVMQNAFPEFCAGGSKTLFSTIMYGFSTVLLAIAYNCISGDAPRFSRKLYTFGAAAAVGNLAINLLLTDLSAKADAALVFPTVHGMKLIMITALSAFIWKEKLTVRQVSAALAAVICICVLAI